MKENTYYHCLQCQVGWLGTKNKCWVCNRKGTEGRLKTYIRTPRDDLEGEQ